MHIHPAPSRPAGWAWESGNGISIGGERGKAATGGGAAAKTSLVLVAEADRVRAEAERIRAEAALARASARGTSRVRGSGVDGAFASTAVETDLLLSIGRTRGGGEASAAPRNSRSAIPPAVARHTLLLLGAGRSHSFESAEIDNRRGGLTGVSDIPFIIVPARPAEAVLEYAGAAYAELLSEHDACTPGVWERGELLSSGDERDVWDDAPVVKKRKVVAKRANAPSRFRGVSWKKMERGWVTQIRISGKQKHIGTYDDETEAARAYDAAVRAQSLDQPLNFPADLDESDGGEVGNVNIDGAAYADQLSEQGLFTPGVWERGDSSSLGDERGDLNDAPAAKKRKVVAKRRHFRRCVCGARECCTDSCVNTTGAPGSVQIPSYFLCPPAPPNTKTALRKLRALRDEQWMKSMPALRNPLTKARVSKKVSICTACHFQPWLLAGVAADCTTKKISLPATVTLDKVRLLLPPRMQYTVPGAWITEDGLSVFIVPMLSPRHMGGGSADRRIRQRRRREDALEKAKFNRFKI